MKNNSSHPSNSKSEDTQELANTVANLKVDGERANLYRPTIEPPQDTCDCLCHNPDALKWGCEHCAMPPQDATIHDVVNGTPKGQEAVQKAIDDSIKVQNEMTKKAQDTSLDDIVIPDDIEQLCAYLFDQVQSYRTVEGWDGMFKIKDRVLAWHKAEIAKLLAEIERLKNEA